MEWKNIIAILGIIIPVVAIIASYYIGVRAGTVNEKRKEWNAIVEPVLIILEEQLFSWQRNNLCKYDQRQRQNDFPYKAIDAIKRRLSGKSLDLFSELFSEYHKAKRQISNGPVRNYSEALKAVEPLIEFLKLK